MKKLLKNIHPDEILTEDFLQPLGMSPHEFAQKTGIPKATLARILRERTPITPKIAMKLANYFGSNIEF